MTFDELWKREGWFSEDTSEFELAKAAYKAGEEEARAAVAAALAELRDQAGHSNIVTTSLYLHASSERATATRLKVQ